MSNTCHFPVGFVPLLRNTTLFAVAVCLCAPCLADDASAPEAEQAAQYAELIGASPADGGNQRGATNSTAAPRATSGIVTRLPSIGTEQGTAARTLPPRRTAPSTTQRLGNSGTRIDASAARFYAETKSTKQSSKQPSNPGPPPVLSRLPLADASKSPPAATRQGKLPGLSAPLRNLPAGNRNSGATAVGAAAASSAHSRQASPSPRTVAKASSLDLTARQQARSQQDTSSPAAPLSQQSPEPERRDATMGPLNLSLKLPPVKSTVVGDEVEPSAVPMSARDVQAPFPQLTFPDLADLALQKVTQKPDGETASVEEAMGVLKEGQGSASSKSADNPASGDTKTDLPSTVKTPDAIASDPKIPDVRQPSPVAPPVSRRQLTLPTASLQGLETPTVDAASKDQRTGITPVNSVPQDARYAAEGTALAAPSKTELSQSRQPGSQLVGSKLGEAKATSESEAKATSRTRRPAPNRPAGTSATLAAGPRNPLPPAFPATETKRPTSNAAVTKLVSQLAESNRPIATSTPEFPEADLWSFQFADAPWPTVLKEFSREMGLSLTMNATPDGTFTYSDDRAYDVSDAIDIFNDHLIPRGTILVRRDEQLVVFGTNEPVPDNFVPFVNAEEIDTLGRNALAGAAIPVTGMNADLAAQEAATVTSKLGAVRPFTNSGRILVIDTGTHLRRVRDLLMQSGFARDNTVSQVYQLKHAKAEEVAKAINDFLKGNPEAARGPVVSIRSTGHVTPEATTNSVLFRGSFVVAQEIERLIRELDRSPREVLLQAVIVEVQLGNTQELGVELGFQDSVLFDRSIIDSIQTITETVTAPNGVQTTNQRILSQVSTPGLAFNSPILGNNAINPSRVGSQGLSSFGLGRVNGDLGYGGLVLSAGSESVNVLLRALDARFDLDVLSRPQVRTVENVEAFIQVGQQVPVVDGVQVNSVGTANPIVRQDQAGIILRATPRISPDGRVQVVVETEKSAFNLARGTGVPIFTDATTGRVIEAPVKDITTASTTVSVQSGQTIVLGGMISNSNNVAYRKVPFLGDVPLLGRLFRYDFHEFEKRELLVFLTPIVLSSDALSDALLEAETNRHRAACVVAEELENWRSYRQELIPMYQYDPITVELDTEGNPIVVEELSAPIEVPMESFPSMAPGGRSTNGDLPQGQIQQNQSPAVLPVQSTQKANAKDESRVSRLPAWLKRRSPSKAATKAR